MTRPSIKRRSRAGYTLIEMLLVVTGTAAVAGIGTTLLIGVRRVSAAAVGTAETGSALSRLHRALHEDAAAATGATAGEDRLTLFIAPGSTVIYRTDGAAVVRQASVRGEPAGRDRFPVGGEDFQYLAEPDAGGVRVAVRYDRANSPDGAADGRAVELAGRVFVSGEGGE